VAVEVVVELVVLLFLTQVEVVELVVIDHLFQEEQNYF
jgi:hypothetical protein